MDNRHVVAERHHQDDGHQPGKARNCAEYDADHEADDEINRPRPADERGQAELQEIERAHEGEPYTKKIGAGMGPGPQGRIRGFYLFQPNSFTSCSKFTYSMSMIFCSSSCPAQAYCRAFFFRKP